MIFVDTSAFLALLSRNDRHHARAAVALGELRMARQALVTHEYVLVETIALVQGRLGIEPVRALTDALLPIVDVTWVDPELHAAARGALISAGRRTVSLVDWTSFLVMRRQGIQQAFTFDADFATEGFEILPAPG